MLGEWSIILRFPQFTVAHRCVGVITAAFAAFRSTYSSESCARDGRIPDKKLLGIGEIVVQVKLRHRKVFEIPRHGAVIVDDCSGRNHGVQKL